MIFRKFLAVIVTLSQVDSGSTPEKAVIISATEGENVRLECNRTVTEPVDWKYTVDVTHMTTYICINGRLMEDQKNKFELDVTTYSLTIKNVTTDDSCLYYCVEEAGFGEKHFIRLTVDKKNTSQSILSINAKGGSLDAVQVVLIIVMSLAVVAALLVVSVVYFIRTRIWCFQEHVVEAGSAAERTQLKDRSDRMAVVGIAHLHNSLYFILHGSRVMKSLRMQWHESWISGRRDRKLKPDPDYELPRVIPSSDVTANDLVASREQNVLYIADDCNTILKCLPPGLRPSNAKRRSTPTHECTRRVPTSRIEPLLEECNAWTISLTYDVCLLVTTRTQMLVEIDPDGEMKNRITVPDNMKVSHAVKTKRNTYIACHTGQCGNAVMAVSTEDTVNDGLTEFDLTSGYVVRSFVGPRGGGMGRVNRPSHLAIDDAGRVCVADSGNRRVLLMNDRLEVECVLVETEAEPRRLCYINETSELVVGMDDGAIGVYRIHGRTAELIDMFPETRHRATSM